MKLFISGGVKFYTLAEGEAYPDPHADNRYVGAYVVFPFEGKWCVQILERNTWRDLTVQHFETDNIAFNFAYNHYVAQQEKQRNNR